MFARGSHVTVNLVELPRECGLKPCSWRGCNFRNIYSSLSKEGPLSPEQLFRIQRFLGSPSAWQSLPEYILTPCARNFIKK